MKFFSVGEQATKQARKLKKEKGISVTPSNYNREGLDNETQNVLNSLREMMSVVCVQLKKIVLTSETKMVQKRRFRRHFFLANISQIYANFKAEFPSLKLDFLLLSSSKNKKKLYGSFFMDGVQLPQGYSHFEEAIYFIPQSPQKFLVLTLSTSEEWKAESTLEPPSGFEHWTPGLGIQHLNH